VLLSAAAAAAAGTPRYVTFAEARPVLGELAGQLPAALSGAQQEAGWPGWVERHDREIRARLEQGDEDTIINWMLFGTSFTSQPRAILGAVEATTSADRDAVIRRTIELISARMEDLVRALATPGNDERRLFARAVLRRHGLTVDTPAGAEAVREFLLGSVMRVAQEQEQVDQELGATSGGDSIAEFIQRSQLFRARGLSLDTSLLPNFSVEQSLAAMKARGLLKAGQLRRVAIIGPGLDFADKDVGFDFYPQQTVQPFAVLDSIRRLALGPTAGDPEIVLFDISPRVIDHVTRARGRAADGQAYVLHLALTKATTWTPEVRRYWESFGDRIGASEPTSLPPAVSELADLRAVRAAPAAVQRMSAVDLNIVTQRIDGELFDLMIATNVFVYYDTLEQALAMLNAEAMLKPGAFLLANFAAPNLRALTIRPVDTHTTMYSRAQNQAESILDFLVWYRAHDAR
jgi:hypothetical protein